MSEQPDEPWDDPVPEDGQPDQPAVERYGPGEAEVVIWDTTSNYSRIRAMRLEGQTPAQIAAALDLKPSTVKQALTNQLKAESAYISAEDMGGILGLEMERLDHMLQSHWFAAKAGDIDSTKAVLAIGKERREWLKWAQPEPTADLGITNNILVIGGTEAEFLAGLDQARQHLEAKHGTIETEDAEVVDEGEPDAGPEHQD